jgi:hypothetical protein
MGSKLARVVLLLYWALLAIGTSADASEPEAVVKARLALIRNDYAQAEKERFKRTRALVKARATECVFADIEGRSEECRAHCGVEQGRREDMA